MIYFALPEVGIRLGAFEAGVAALAINAGAYLTEIIRAGPAGRPERPARGGPVDRTGPAGRLPERRLSSGPPAVYPPVVNQFIQVDPRLVARVADRAARS